MDHRKNLPLTETQNYLEQNDMTNTIEAEQHSEAHILGAKSSDSSDKPTDTKNDIVKQDAMKLCTSPEPADMNNLYMNVAETISLEKNEKIVIPQSHCLDTNKEKEITGIINDSKENRIFGQTSDNLSALNTEAVKFSFGSSTTDTPYKEAIVFSARDRHRNQNEADALKQNTLKLRKLEETTHSNISDIKECNARVQGVGESVGVPCEHLSQEEKDDVQIKQNSSKEILSQSIMPSTKDKYATQRQNYVTVGSVVEKEQKDNSENKNISNKQDMTLNPDTDAENIETICKTCLALQAAEKFNYKSFSVVIDTLTEENQKPSKGDFSCNEKQDVKKIYSQKCSDETVHEETEPHNFTDTQHEMNDISETEQYVSSAQKVGFQIDSQKFTDETVCGKAEPHHFADTQHDIYISDLVTTKLEQVSTDETIVSSSADKKVDMENAESSSIPNTLPVQHDSVEPKYSVSSENSDIVENDSQPSAESLETDEQTKVKKHKRGWFTRLFSKLHKRKLKKVIECDIVSTPSKSCS